MNSTQIEKGSILERFRRFMGREPSDTDIQRIGRLQETFELRGTDSIWLLWWACEYYVRLYETFPNQIQHAAKESAEAVTRTGGAQLAEIKATVLDAIKKYSAMCDASIAQYKAMAAAEHAKMAAVIADSLNKEVPTALKRAARGFEWRSVGITVAISAMMLFSAWAVGHYTRDTVVYQTTSAAPVSAADFPTKDVHFIARKKHKKQAAAATRGKTTEGATDAGNSESGGTFLQ